MQFQSSGAANTEELPQWNGEPSSWEAHLQSMTEAGFEMVSRVGEDEDATIAGRQVKARPSWIRWRKKRDCGERARSCPTAATRDQ